MPKITFMGAGSTVFAKNVLGDCMLQEPLQNSTIALYDINPTRLDESHRMLENLNANINENRAKIECYCGPEQRKDALRGANFVVNAIQVGGYEPSTVIDFEVPKKYGLRQTIGDTLGIGGIFRALRTIPVMMDFARDIEEVCQNAWLLNYTNPMAMLTGAMLRATNVKTVGLCHSVQSCVKSLMQCMNYDEQNIPYDESKSDTEQGIRARIAGINHQAWLISLTMNGEDIYPKVKEIGRELVKKYRAYPVDDPKKLINIVRLEIMNRFGYYVTESSEHSSEYMPYWIKSTHPELIDEFKIPLDEYPRRCIHQIEEWKKLNKELCGDTKLTHKLSNEYGSRIMRAIHTGVPIQIGGNVLNTGGLISNLPENAVVEVPCLVDGNGIQGCRFGALPTQCAAINMTNINVQLLTIEAALTRKRETIYQAAMLDPHTSAELTIDQIVAMCDDLIEAHGDMLPKYN